MIIREKFGELVQKNLVMSKNWNELEALMEKQNYQDVKKVEYK